jgi:N-acetylneuraminic acid mutarotase
MKFLAILLLLMAPAAAWAGVCSPGWSNSAVLPQSVLQAHAAYYGGKVFLVGGVTTDGYLPNVLIYDVASHAWSAGEAYDAEGWTGACVVAHQGKVYAFGGYRSDAGGQYLAHTLIYDVAAGQWSVGAPMPFSASDAACAAVEGLIYVAGGYDGAYRTEAAAYDIAHDAWETPLAPLPLGRAMAVGDTNGLGFFVVGGETAAGADAATLIYDPADNSWSSLGRLNVARAAAAGGYADGDFYIFAGGGAGGELWAPVDSSELFDFNAGSWSLFSPSVPVALVASASAFAPDLGGVFVLAGGGAQQGEDVMASDLTQVFSFCRPLPTSIEPDAGPDNEDVAVTITGSGFQVGDLVTLHEQNGVGVIELKNVLVEAQDTIAAVVPAGATPGRYDLEVTNDSSVTGMLAGAYEVQSAGGEGNDDLEFDDDVELSNDNASSAVNSCANLCCGCADCISSCDVHNHDDDQDDDTDDDTHDDDSHDDDASDDDFQKEGGSGGNGCGC